MEVEIRKCTICKFVRRSGVKATACLFHVLRYENVYQVPHLVLQLSEHERDRLAVEISRW